MCSSLLARQLKKFVSKLVSRVLSSTLLARQFKKNVSKLASRLLRSSLLAKQAASTVHADHLISQTDLVL